LASPFGVASRCLMHCRPRVAGKIRGILTYRRPSLPLVYHQRSPMSALSPGSNIGFGSRSLTDLTARLTVRADDGHAPPLSLFGKPFRLTFILLSIPVRFPALDPIEPQPPPLVCSPANSLKFHPCGRTPQVARLTSSLRHCRPSKGQQHQTGIVYG
jgi:hypothetical protein